MNYSGYLEYDEHDRTYSRKKKKTARNVCQNGVTSQKKGCEPLLGGTFSNNHQSVVRPQEFKEKSVNGIEAGSCGVC